MPVIIGFVAVKIDFCLLIAGGCAPYYLFGDTLIEFTKALELLDYVSCHAFSDPVDSLTERKACVIVDKKGLVLI